MTLTSWHVLFSLQNLPDFISSSIICFLISFPPARMHVLGITDFAISAAVSPRPGGVPSSEEALSQYAPVE